MDISFDVIDDVRGFDPKSDGLSGESLDEDLPKDDGEKHVRPDVEKGQTEGHSHC